MVKHGKYELICSSRTKTVLHVHALNLGSKHNNVDMQLSVSPLEK